MHFTFLTTQNSTGMGHLLKETKIASKSAAEGSNHTHIYMGEQDCSKHKNIDLELNRIIMLHVHWTNTTKSVSTWAFSTRRHQRKWVYTYAQAPWVVRGAMF